MSAPAASRYNVKSKQQEPAQRAGSFPYGFFPSHRVGADARDLRVAQRADRVEVHAGSVERFKRVMPALGALEGCDRFLLQRTADTGNFFPAIAQGLPKDADFEIRTKNLDDMNEE